MRTPMYHKVLCVESKDLCCKTQVYGYKVAMQTVLQFLSRRQARLCHSPKKIKL